jgi:hypothetical protein
MLGHSTQSSTGRNSTKVNAMKIFFSALAITVAALMLGCDSDSSQSSSDDSSATATSKPVLRPTWARLVPGVRAYTRATIREDDDNSVEACPTVTDFTNTMQSENNSCNFQSAGDLVLIHKTRQDPGVFGGDAIYVVAKGWSGLVKDDDIVPVVPKGTVLHCNENDDSGWDLYVGGYSNDDDVSIGRSAFKAVIAHTLEPSETLGPEVHVLSGGGRGKDGHLLFSDISDKQCFIDGTPFSPDFDTYSYEREEPADGSPPQ